MEKSMYFFVVSIIMASFCRGLISLCCSDQKTRLVHSVADKFKTDSCVHLSSRRELSKPVSPIIDLFLHTGKKHSFSNGPSLSSTR